MQLTRKDSLLGIFALSLSFFLISAEDAQYSSKATLQTETRLKALELPKDGDANGTGDESDPDFAQRAKVFQSLLTWKNLVAIYGERAVYNFPVIEENHVDIRAQLSFNPFKWFSSSNNNNNNNKNEGEDKQVKFILYTNKSDVDSGREINIGDIKSLQEAGFDPEAPIKFLCHGFNGNFKKGIGPKLKTAYFDRIGTNERINIVVIDWSQLARIHRPSKFGLSDIFYFPPAQNTKIVGETTARMIEFLEREANVSLANIHLIGHSLGAHAMGWCGRSYEGYSKIEQVRIPRITGLDPASPCYEFKLPVCLGIFHSYQPLKNTDADFVDVIHTHSNFLGYTKELGHADFYPNSGKRQPGCGRKNFSLNHCSHSRSVVLMAESIVARGEQGFRGVECNNWDEFKRNQCNYNKTALMGEECPTGTQGKFYLRTGRKPPFYLL